MIDVHCHIIPKLDDGSDDIDKSVKQLRLMAEGGIEHVFLTSHYFKGHYEYSRDVYDARFEELSAAVSAADMNIMLHPGFEIFLQPGILDDIVAKGLYLGDSDYVLLESELNGLPSDFYANVFPLLRKGIKPVLAHAERYVSIMRKPTEARDLIDKNVYLQVNASSLLGFYGEKVRKTAWTLVENGWVHFLGSDDHVRGSYGSYFAALELLAKKTDGYTVELLTQKYPHAILENHSIPYRYVQVERPRHKHRKKSLWRRVFS
ncbi:MAG: CpsB/CapC family capsule biosynthesis tyrosine phosphatase [Candidatus Cloacimonadaceae bacterium]|nr:CpsB/CapC family capsule biosynthesis tyrosine phosphatase [Candidatus Cloacimonadaceae bacterium]MDP3113186.1 CpsB/CapC family capsule biosynthesis tyrosine phosphatase [Candidatus Cloacimonadaceae bacterium]